MPAPGSRTSQDRIHRRAVDHDLDARAFRGILAGVGEQVRQHLAQPHAVAIDEHSSRAISAHRHHLVSRIQHRLHRFQRRIHHGIEAQSVRDAVTRPAARDARDVEQVVDEVREMAGLPLDHLARAANRRRVGAALGEHVGDVANRAPADCAIRAPAWRGTRPCGGRLRAALARGWPRCPAPRAPRANASGARA